MIQPSAPAIEKEQQNQLESDDIADECIICFEAIDSNASDQVTLKCGHSNFHRECLKEWKSKSQGTCPMCRQRFTSSQIYVNPPTAKTNCIALNPPSDLNSQAQALNPPRDSNSLAQASAQARALKEKARKVGIAYFLISSAIVIVALCREPPRNFTFVANYFSLVALSSYAISALVLTCGLILRCSDDIVTCLIGLPMVVSFFSGGLWYLFFGVILIISAGDGETSKIWEVGGPWHIAMMLLWLVTLVSSFVVSVYIDRRMARS